MWYLIALGIIGVLLCLVGAYLDKKNDFGQPLYITGIIALAALALALFFYACMEVWYG